jgi:hypothetical protein
MLQGKTPKIIMYGPKKMAQARRCRPHAIGICCGP